MTIHKYPLEITDLQYVAIPNDFQITLVGLDPKGTPCIWAIVDPERSSCSEPIRIIRTGHFIPPDTRKHIGSFVQESFVWHVFLA